VSRVARHRMHQVSKRRPPQGKLALKVADTANGPKFLASRRLVLSVGNPLEAFRSWITRALESPSRRAMAAREATAPLSSWRCHSAARTVPLGRSRLSARLRRLLAAAKSTTTHDAKFLIEELLGANVRSRSGSVLTNPRRKKELGRESPVSVGNGMRRAHRAFGASMLRALLYCVLLAGLSAGWLAMAGAGCVITLDRGLALLGFACGTLGAAGFALLAAANAWARWWDERRSRAWRLP